MHKKEISIRTCSIFEGIKKDAMTYCNFLYFWSRELIQQDISYELESNKNSVSKWSLRLREVIRKYLVDNNEMLGGLDVDGNPKVVEIDECLFFRAKYNRGRFRDAQWTFGGVERGSKKCFLIPVADRSAAALIPIIEANILPNTIIISDCWTSYNSLANNPNYVHLSVNHFFNFLSPDCSDIHILKIRRIAGYMQKNT